MSRNFILCPRFLYLILEYLAGLEPKMLQLLQTYKAASIGRGYGWWGLLTRKWRKKVDDNTCAHLLVEMHWCIFPQSNPLLKEEVLVPEEETTYLSQQNILYTATIPVSVLNNALWLVFIQFSEKFTAATFWALLTPSCLLSNRWFFKDLELFYGNIWAKWAVDTATCQSWREY